MPIPSSYKFKKYLSLFGLVFLTGFFIKAEGQNLRPAKIRKNA